MAEKPKFPGCEKALQPYYNLRQRLYDYYFRNIDLKISNSETIGAYSQIFNLINKNPQDKLSNEKKFQLYEETLFRTFKKDLSEFSQEVRRNLISQSGTSSSVSELNFYYEWIVHYTWFLRWTHKIISPIQKNISVFSRNSLYYTGLTILREEIIQPLFQKIIKLIMSNLELFKEGSLQQYSQLQYMIRVIGMCGFTKFLSVKLQKNDTGNFNFVSMNKETNELAEDQYETAYFLNKFTHEYVKFLKKKYDGMVQDMIQMSTTQYVIQATQIIQKQTKAADFLYPSKSVKNIVIRSIQEILVTNKCKDLIYNEKSGVSVMMEENDIDGLKFLYKLAKRGFQQKIFGQCYQETIQKYINQQILNKLSPEDEKLAKKQVVFNVIGNLLAYQAKVEKITKSIIQYIKDPYDIVLMTCQQNGFQLACNKNNTVCIFLAFYCDLIFKKQPNINDTNGKQLVAQVSKMLKFLYSLDQFLKVYQKMLGLRILYDQFKNKELELDVINMLKNEVGIASMTKMTAMIQDYKFSENFNSEKLSTFRTSIPFNFQITILTSGQWQVQDFKNGRKLVPPQLLKAVDIFQKQYHQLYPGREITWIFNYGRAIAQMKLNDNSKVLLLLSNYQLLILLLAQRRKYEPMKILEIISQIKPQEEPGLMASIMMLVKKGVLKKDGNPVKIQSKNETISINFSLAPKSSKIPCFEIPRYAEKSVGVSNEINLERAFIIQANIVKLMKAKRILAYQQIVTQVTNMCKTFKAESGMIKNQIESCIHKQYLERDQNSFNTLIYKP